MFECCHLVNIFDFNSYLLINIVQSEFPTKQHKQNVNYAAIYSKIRFVNYGKYTCKCNLCVNYKTFPTLLSTAWKLGKYYHWKLFSYYKQMTDLLRLILYSLFTQPNPN